MAIKKQAGSSQLRLEDLPYRAMLGIYGSWLGLILACCCIAASIYVAFPADMKDFSMVEFFQELLTIVIVTLCYVGWKFWKKTSVVKLAEADLVSGRRELDLHEEKLKEIEERKEWGPLKRVYRFFC